MATKDNNPGLLSKVAKFVRNPTTDWGDLEKEEPAQASEHSKQALKNMIERKRHNDAVRKREFDQLRKLRRTAHVITPDLAGTTSFFRGNTDYSDLDERAMTLKKIDEIEAHMSKQWWKGKQMPPPPSPLEHSIKPKVKFPGFAAERDGATEDHSAFASTQLTDESSDLDNEPTLMGQQSAGDFSPTDPGHGRLPDDSRKTFSESDSSGFSTSKFTSVELGASLSDPELEEAAIRFANSDDAGAEAVLWAALQAESAQAASVGVWAAALFDLYRSTGQQASFERIALEYAQRFGRSAPVWFSTPQQLGLNASPSQAMSVTAPVSLCERVWVAPQALGLVDLETLRKHVTLAGGPCCLNWQALEVISADAAPLLAVLFAAWCDQPLQLQIEAAETLTALLKINTPVGDNQVEEFWWELRLNFLRVLRLQDEFDLVALDFCVTYEVSPPSWKDARCERIYASLSETSQGVGSFNSNSPMVNAEALDSQPVVDMLAQVDPRKGQMDLCGEVVGDATRILMPLQKAADHTAGLIVSCSRLIRVDFSAAGSILNWVASVESNGGRIEFHDVPCLVAAFFNLIGISEHAQVDTRKN
jgi:ABC-type transporter Mla MlaB component